MMTQHQEPPIASHILMVRPANFGYNEQTAASNAFQQQDNTLTPEVIQNQALAEFDQFVEKLQAAGVNIIVIEDTPQPKKTDAIFPNNWVTFHADGRIITYPMYAPVRRLERREEVVRQIMQQFGFQDWVHLENAEADNLFLEGTGSMILDRTHRLAYACISPRTDVALLHSFCEIAGYEPVAFRAVDGNGQDIYHTNVMMALGTTFVVICLDTVRDDSKRALLLEKFQQTGKEVVHITLAQMQAFAGNMLQVQTTLGEPLLVMSEQAYLSLTKEQIEQLKRHTNVLHSSLYTIEKYGGGSARCMMAEVFVPSQASKK